MAPEKGGLNTSDKQLMSLIVKWDRTLAPVAADSAANLGVDYTAGKRHRPQASPTFVGRLEEVLPQDQEDLCNASCYCRQDGPSAVTVWGRPSVAYSDCCYGLSDAQLLQRRRTLAITLTPAARGRFLDTVCLLHGDPYGQGLVGTCLHMGV